MTEATKKYAARREAQEHAMQAIATRFLGINSVNPSNNEEGMRVTEQTVWNLRFALEAAFEAGRASAEQEVG